MIDKIRARALRYADVFVQGDVVGPGQIHLVAENIQAILDDCQMAQEGKGQKEMADETGVSVATIKRDVKALNGSVAK